MSLHLPPPPSPPNISNGDGNLSSDCASSDSDDEDQNWDDWVSDSLVQQPCRSLFEDKTFPSVGEALAHDADVHGFDLNKFSSELSLDFHRRIRLINYIRKTAFVSKLNGSEALFTEEKYLVPVIEDDPLLQIQTDDWTDSDEEGAITPEPAQQIQALQKKLAAAKRGFNEYRTLINQQLNIGGLLDSADASISSPSAPQARDDDSHYFQSYGENDIHAVMIQDKVRTSSYAKFILTNPTLFRDAIVLDVGCGTGILSLFAARGGAKRVVAVDASDIAIKAKQIVKANGLDDIITVIQGKVEEITLPGDITHVDIIISEWMGYALLYESMLDSVLVARDRFLRPGGVMAPSQCKMMLSLCDASEIYKDRVGFWDDIYGFDLSVMAEDLYGEAIVDVVGSNTMYSAPHPIKDLLLSEITQRQLDFTSSFTLVSTSERRTKINSFILYFDTFFTNTGHPVPAVTDVKTVKEGDVILAELWPVGGKSAPKRRQSMGVDKDSITSFSTGPQSMPTHWKQTLFLLREPISVTEGSIVQGTFYCRKSRTNSRELDVEIHYSTKQDADSAANDTIVQMYKVR
ncbi:protein arginine N-methyltransferase [Collybia nuda]|uniref:type I protein arginine methyltransferase n=1 Tax=Collybia nuda TaxID=64659 RepID=A0A9P5Y8M9_9AGAR|nr:protein arginine N-methyltransferase [Collybia nuda]